MLQQKVSCEPIHKDVDNIKKQFEVLKSKYTFFQQKSTMKTYKDMNVSEKLQKETIEYFFNERIEIFKVSKRKINHLIQDFKMIRNYDYVIDIDGDLFAYHTYRLLVYIYDALVAHSCSINKKYLLTTISKNQPTNVYHFEKNFHFHLEQSQDPSLICNKDEVIKTSVNYCYFSQERITKYIVGMLSIFSIYQYIFDKEDEQYKDEVINLFRYISASKPTKPQISLSLAITLNFYMRFKINNFPIKKILEGGIINYILDSCFSSSCSYKSSELLKNIYIADNINFIPIFAIAGRESKNYSDRELQFLQALIKNEMHKMKIPMNLPDYFTKKIISNPVNMYLLKTPSKMLEKFNSIFDYFFSQSL